MAIMTGHYGPYYPISYYCTSPAAEPGAVVTRMLLEFLAEFDHARIWRLYLQWCVDKSTLAVEALIALHRINSMISTGLDAGKKLYCLSAGCILKVVAFRCRRLSEQWGREG